MAWPGLAWPGLAWPGLAWHDDLYIARTLEFCLSEEQHGRGNLLPKMAIRQHKAPRTPDVKKLGVRITRSHARTKKQLSANSKRHAFSIKKNDSRPLQLPKRQFKMHSSRRSDLQTSLSHCSRHPGMHIQPTRTPQTLNALDRASQTPCSKKCHSSRTCAQRSQV